MTFQLTYSCDSCPSDTIEFDDLDLLEAEKHVKEMILHNQQINFKVISLVPKEITTQTSPSTPQNNDKTIDTNPS